MLVVLFVDVVVFIVWVKFVGIGIGYVDINLFVFVKLLFNGMIMIKDNDFVV